MPIPSYWRTIPPEDRWRTEFDGSVPHFVIRDNDALPDSDILFFANTRLSYPVDWQQRMNKAAILAASAPYMYALLDAINRSVAEQEYDHHTTGLTPDLVRAIQQELDYAQHRFIRPSFEEGAAP